MVKSGGFSMVEVLVGIALLGLGSVLLMNMAKEESKGLKRVSLKEKSSEVMKEILVALESKPNCRSLLMNKTSGEQITIPSTSGDELKRNAELPDKFRIEDLNMTFVNVPNLPAEFRIVNVNYKISSSFDKNLHTSDRLSFLGRVSANRLVDCVSPREDGSTLIQNKALQIAKDKVCREDLRGTLSSNGTCNWTPPVNYEYITIQL